MSLRCGIVGLSNAGKSTLFTISHNAEIRYAARSGLWPRIPRNSGI
jgi:ribosome-binding ATPase YchF (GTP1/OBG family)